MGFVKPSDCTPVRESGVPAPTLPDLRTRALLFDLTGRAEIAIAGKDRAAFLHGLVTNDVKKLGPGEGCHAAFLTPKGKMLADLVVLATGDEILLDAEAPLAATLDGLLRKYHFFHEVTLEDRTAARAVLHVEGPSTAALLASLGLSLPAAPHASARAAIAGIDVLLVAESRAGSPGVDVRLPIAAREAVATALETAGAVAAPGEVLEAGRIEAGLPRWGRELDETVLPDEAGLQRTAISYSKGCYIGQETVARIKTYGHVNRQLVGLLADGSPELPLGSPVRAGETTVGALTSVGRRADGTGTIALGFVKRDHAAPGTALTVQTEAGAVPVAVAALPLAV